MIKSQNQKGFTIVELLIVIVVIAILAAITIVAYNGIRNRSLQSSAQSELTSVAKKLQTSKTDSGTEQFPLTLADAGITSTSNVITYSPNIGGGRTEYCATVTAGGQSYYVSSRILSAKLGSCDITNGLTGWWRYNGNTTDSSTSGNTGAITNVTLTTGHNTAANSAYNFNGTNTYITTNVPAIERTSFSATLWFRTSVNGDRKMISATAGGAHIIQIFTVGGGAAVRTCINTCIAGTRNIADGNWHFASVIGTTSGLSIYLDGESVPELTSAYSGALSLGSQIRVGADYTPTFYFNGQIDDVRLYGRSLSIEESQALYSAGAQ